MSTTLNLANPVRSWLQSDSPRATVILITYFGLVLAGLNEVAEVAVGYVAKQDVEALCYVLGLAASVTVPAGCVYYAYTSRKRGDVGNAVFFGGLTALMFLLAMPYFTAAWVTAKHYEVSVKGLFRTLNILTQHDLITSEGLLLASTDLWVKTSIFIYSFAAAFVVLGGLAVGGLYLTVKAGEKLVNWLLNKEHFTSKS